ncbi:MAG: bifunctional phosphoserine phosphatase/homoserine phosphotransferase ThrH, partial [Spirochaetota bacterium]
LMRHRIDVLERRGITLGDIRRAIADVEPLPGETGFLEQLRRRSQVAILSDTFVQFVDGVMERLGRPFLLCTALVTDERDRVVDYRMRQPDGKRRAVEAFRTLNLRVQAVGDSFNDISMIRAAHRGYLFRPSDTVVAAHPDLPVARTHDELLASIASDEHAPA